jgi:hypothetical protein
LDLKISQQLIRINGRRTAITGKLIVLYTKLATTYKYDVVIPMPMQ